MGLEEEIKKNPEKFFKYIEHKTSKLAFHLTYPIFSMFTKGLFSNVKVEGTRNLEGVRRFKDIGTNNENDTANVFISRHLSELEWILKPMIFYKNDIYSINQSGDNLFIGPIGWAMKKFGGFMVIRDKRTFNDGVTFTKKSGGMIYQPYLEKLVGQGENILIYPEYNRNNDKIVKYGRSYSAELLQFTPHIFGALLQAQKNTGKKIRIFPTGVSYERVVEDSNFERLSKIKNKTFKMAVDYGYILLKALTFSRRDVNFTFGESYLLDQNINMGRQAKLAREKVGDLSKVYGTQILFSVMGENQEMSLKDLGKKIDDVMKKILQYTTLESDILSSNLKDEWMNKGPKSLIERTSKVYRGFVGVEGNKFVIYSKPEAKQSRNQVQHILSQYLK